MRRIAFIFAVILCSLLIQPGFAAETKASEKFAIYYADQAPLESFRPYQLVVFDSLHHPALQPLKEQGKTLIGYLTLGEIEATSPYFSRLKSHNLILMENKNWKGSYSVDIRDPLWTKIVVEELVPAILRQGFDGVFLDTLDNAVEMEAQNHARYHGMTEAAEHLVQAIRLHYPTTKIMLNRAYALLPKLASSLDMELGESVYADYNFEKKTYGLVKAEDYQEQVTLLKAGQKLNPQLKIYTLDYAQPSDAKAIAAIYRTERANGFIPYVATVGLDQLVAEPDSK